MGRASAASANSRSLVGEAREHTITWEERRVGCEVGRREERWEGDLRQGCMAYFCVGGERGEVEICVCEILVGECLVFPRCLFEGEAQSDETRKR